MTRLFGVALRGGAKSVRKVAVSGVSVATRRDQADGADHTPVVVNQGSELGHQYFLYAAIGEQHFARDEPDDVAGEGGYLRIGEAHAGHELVGLGKGRAGFEQGPVLRFVVAEVAQEAPPGEFGDLFADGRIQK
jgi:hypothetical protein